MIKTSIAMLLAFSAVPAFAEAPAAAATTVQTADLDLSSAKGQRALDRRLQHAAAEVCGIASPSDLEGQNDARKCRKDTVASLKSERDQRVAKASGQPIEVAVR
jgi:UrcA family protein